MKTLFTALRLLSLLSLLTGALYPLSVWLVGQGLFPAKAEGSLLYQGETVVGSSLLAQKMDDPRFFSPRPSAGDFATVASGASHLAWTSDRLVKRVASSPSKRADEVTTSGSGLDPHLSLDSVLAQLERVAQARGWNETQKNRVREWIAQHSEGGMLYPVHVNILALNLALETLEDQ